ncbi:MAG: hypothetical protein JEZ14_08175 [Marinilabiliaceae bacterium]|nr:hypothetical protein [Marinilabiliaceae bacterium]
MEALLKRKIDEFERFMGLIQQANHWRLSQTIKGYIKALESSQWFVKENGDWLAWAHKKSEWFDPLVNGEDELLDDQYREMVFKIKKENKNLGSSYNGFKLEYNWFEYQNAPYKYWR